MPSVEFNMSGSSQEDLLGQDLMHKLKIDSSSEQKLLKEQITTSLKNDHELVNSNNCPYGSAAQTIASLLAPKMTAHEANNRCVELEAELKAEREKVAKLKDQLAHSEKMLSELRLLHSLCPSVKKFEDLPEELMLHIFSFLPTDTLIFTIRKVCRQWKRLTEDFDLWSKVSIVRDFNRLIRTLHYAPCLRNVCIPSEYLTVHDDKDDEYLQILTRTKCRVRALTMPDFQPIMLRVLRNQMPLGALRHVHINSWWDNLRLAHRDEVWEALALLDLHSLTLHEFDGGNSYFDTAFRPAPGHFANLRHLDLYCKAVPGALLDDLLRACRASLQTVSLPPKSRGEALALLADCPRLSEANVPFLEHVCALEGNTRLELLELNAEWLPRSVVELVIPEVIRFLHMPAVVQRLRTLFFQGMPVGCRELMQAVTKVRGLRYVRVHNFGEPEAAALMPRVLDALPRLERFTIATLPPPQVLDGIAECPSLRELTLIGACHDDAHGCRIPAVMRLLSTRPGLHVFLDLGLGVRGHLEGLYPDCLRYHRHVCPDESLWHRFHPVMANHAPDRCSWCLYNLEDYATAVNMEGKLDVDAVPALEDDT